MTAKRTRLCYWIARPAKPGLQSSNTSRVRFIVISHTLGRSRFYDIHILSKRNWVGAFLMNLTQQCSFFHIRNVFLCVAESWWKMPFKVTRHGDAVEYVIVAALIRLFGIMTSRGSNTNSDVTVREWVMNIHYQTWIVQGRFINISRTPSKQWGVCDE